MLPYKQTEVNEFLQRKETMEMPTFKTIRQTAALGILTEHRLRLKEVSAWLICVSIAAIAASGGRCTSGTTGTANRRQPVPIVESG